VTSSYQDLLAQARTHIPEVDAAGLTDLLAGATPPLVIDVREQAEWDEGFIPGSVHVPRGFLESRIAGVASHDTPIVLSCAAGNRSLLAAVTLAEMGYTDVTSLAGGFTDWKRGGRPFDVPRTLTQDQRRRYARHLSLSEVGEEGQLRLTDGRGRHDRPGGRRRRRRVQPAAPDHPHDRPRRSAEG